MRKRDSMNFILNSFYLGEAVQKQLLLCKFVAEAFCFHSRAVEFYKSAFISFGFFGTLCTRPATKSKISARASTREVVKHTDNNTYRAISFPTAVTLRGSRVQQIRLRYASLLWNYARGATKSKISARASNGYNL